MHLSEIEKQYRNKIISQHSSVATAIITQPATSLLTLNSPIFVKILYIRKNRGAIETNLCWYQNRFDIDMDLKNLESL